MTPSSPDAGTDLTAAFDRAISLERYLDDARHSLEMWHAQRRRARLPDDLRSRAEALPGPRRLLVLLEDWCGDAVNTVPVLERLAAEVPDVHLRVLGRDDNPDLMQTHLTRGSRSIPVVMVLDPDGRELGWWGPRPSPLQRWVLDEGLDLESGERYRRARHWYARDRGRTTLAEVLDIMERGPASQGAGAGEEPGPRP